MSERKPVLTYVLLTLASLQWGANVVFGRMAVGEITPMLLVTLRFLIVSAVMLLFYGRGFRRDLARLKVHIGYMVFLGVCGFTGFTAFFYVAAHYTSGANMAIIQGATPLFVFSFAYLADKRRIGRWQALGMALALVGVVFVASHGSWESLRHMHFNVGDLCMVGATCVYSIYTVGLSRRPEGVSTMSVFTMLAMVAFVTSLPLSGYEMLTRHVGWPTAKGWGLTFLIALFPSFLAQVFYIIGVQNIGPGRAGIFINLIPVFGACLSVIFLGERMGWYQIVGLVVVMAGIISAQRGKF